MTEQAPKPCTECRGPESLVPDHLMNWGRMIISAYNPEKVTTQPTDEMVDEVFLQQETAGAHEWATFESDAYWKFWTCLTANCRPSSE